MQTYLFVYGTLMKGIPSRMASFLEQQGSFLGEGSVQGWLYDLGNYPGLIFDAQAENEVIGHIFRLEHPSFVFEKLDAFEGIEANDSGEYTRIEIPVRFQNQILYCWVYQYNRDTKGLPVITQKSYLAYFFDKPAHRRFIEAN